MFPKDSAFKQVMDAAAGIAPDANMPTATPEIIQKDADTQPSRVFIPVSDLEDWIEDLERFTESAREYPLKASDFDDLDQMASEMRSYFKG